MELTVKEKEAILKQSLKNIMAQIYDMTISATIANRVGNKNAETIQKNLELLEKTKHEYEKEIAELVK